ncbi:MAG: AAA family ATPase [Saprospiraceae bacterium]|nr:AAA family ATPase [Saprospiraceae bacterium]
MTLKEQIKNLLIALNKDVFEKEDVIKLALLSALANESIFLLGAPGVAKSLIARRLKFAFSEATSFDYLMNRFSTPDEIFGPVSISKLKDEDKYERLVKNYLPSSSIVFLDEIWKAGASIQNALLTVLNEKIYRNGEQEIRVPIKVLIAASNELPAEGEGLEALWDRFLVRFIVENVQKTENFNDMISKTLTSYQDNVPDDLKITNQQYTNIQTAIDAIALPTNVFNVIHVIRHYINDYNKNQDNSIYISDRRWRKIVRLLRTSALLNDRKEVDLMDCFLMQHCLWNDPEQIKTVYNFVKDAIQKHGYQLNINVKDIKEQIEELDTETKEETKFIIDTREEKLVVFHADYYEIQGVNKDVNKTINKDVNNDINKFISIADFNELNTTEQLFNLYDVQLELGELYKNPVSKIRKGSTEFTVLVEETEYNLTTITHGDKRQITKKPHKTVEKHWDNAVNDLFIDTNLLKEQLNNYRNNDLKHLRINLFVNPVLADIVSTHVYHTQKEIEKLDIELKQIQHNYKTLEDAEIIIEDKI